MLLKQWRKVFVEGKSWIYVASHLFYDFITTFPREVHSRVIARKGKKHKKMKQQFFLLSMFQSEKNEENARYRR